MDGSLIASDRPLCIAILAMGGQGGGVLADWIVAMAEATGWIAQSTSVPGVAQRTGATIYYVEIIRARPASAPILSLFPAPGDVDVVIAAEWMEAGRAILRGLVTPECTALIASTHRALAVVEKQVPGDGIADGSVVQAAAADAARILIAADMQALAEQAGSVISAVLFGALAASHALPFARPDFEAAIRAGGVGVEPSLRAFAAGFAVVGAPPPAIATPRPPLPTAPWTAALPAAARGLATAGHARLTDYQDGAYAEEYRTIIERLAAINPALAPEAARQVAVAMAYDDVIRVADLKTRSARFARVRTEARTRPDQILTTTEYMHPRVTEIFGLLPARLGARLERSPTATRITRRLFERGRRVRTTALSGFLPLYLVAGLRPWRRATLRHARETAWRAAWLAHIESAATRDIRVAVELLRCRRLVKGYSDTHVRGLGKYNRVLAALPLIESRSDAADWLRRLREAALADETGVTLDGALATIRSFHQESVA